MSRRDRVSDDVFNFVISTANNKTPALAVRIRELGPIEFDALKHPSVADHLFVEIVNQQLSTRAGDAIWSRVVEEADQRGLEVRELFTVENAPILRGCGVSGRKAKALVAVRDAEIAGRLKGDALSRIAHAERVEALTAIWGIGQWTADMIGIFHFFDPDIWPAGDVAAVGTLRKITGHAATSALAAEFAPHRSTLARYLWRIRDSVPLDKGSGRRQPGATPPPSWQDQRAL